MAPILLLFVVGLLLIFLGVPVAFSLLAGSLTALLLFGGPSASVPMRMLGSLDVWVWLALPLFILMGHLMNNGGITPRLVRFSQSVVGHLWGGLSHVVVMTNTLMAGMSGSMLADLTATGVFLTPELRKEGYSAGYSAAIVGSASIIGPLIPPSIPFVIYGVLSGASIGRLFIGGIVPGLLTAMGLLVAGFLISRKRMPRKYGNTSWREILVSGFVAVPALFVPVIIIGGMRLGFFTPTEGAAVGSIYVLLLGIAVYRGLSLRSTYQAFLETARSSSAILFIVAAAGAFSYALAYFGAADRLTRVVADFVPSAGVFLWGSVALLLVLGALMDTTAIQMVFIPVLAPIAARFGVDPIHYGLVFSYSVLIGVLTPPYGVGMFVLMRLVDIGVAEYTREMLPFLFVLLLVLAVVVAFPQPMLFLPNLVYGSR